MDNNQVPLKGEAHDSARDPRFILLGGFLGAGKTTCMTALARWLREQGMRCGLITNDQADGLVDTALALAGAGDGDADAVRQVTGGCFCCRANELGSALMELDEAARPDVFIAEPVGSCTDLVATVLLPLKDIYQRRLIAAPMSVVMDSRRLHGMILGRMPKNGRSGFSRDVRYIYLKQLEEAEIIVLNKADLLKPLEMTRLVKKLTKDWPDKKIFQVSARTGEGLDHWFRLLISGTRSTTNKLMDMDYGRYGSGEALLGWFNARLRLREGHWHVDGNALLEGLARNIQKKLEEKGIEIAHFKMSLQPVGDDPTDGLVVVNAVRNGTPAEISRRMTGKVRTADILINLRAEGPPEMLKSIVRGEIRDLPLSLESSAAFRPGQPVPVHRVTDRTTLEADGPFEQPALT